METASTDRSRRIRKLEARKLEARTLQNRRNQSPTPPMNLRRALAEEHSKTQTLRIVTSVGRSRRRFAELVDIVTGDDAVLAQRGSWAISGCAETQPDIVQPYLRALLENLQRPGLHDAVTRHTLKAVAEFELPEDLAGLAAGIAFDHLGSPDAAVAIKVYAMTILESICRREPALTDELLLHIRHQLPRTSAAFRSRARHVLERLESSA